MRKLLCLVLCLTMCLSVAFASNNEQKIYPVDTPIYSALEKLYIIDGRALPSSSGPWSANELIKMLNRIDRNGLSDQGKAYYDAIADMLDDEPPIQYEDNMGLKFFLNANLQAFYHTNTEKFVDEGNWIHGFNYREPLLKFGLETWPLDHFYGYFELAAENGIGENYGTNTNLIYKNNFVTNIPLFMTPATKGDFDWAMPHRAFVSAGGNQWSVTAGRDKLSWGSGESGNLMLGSHFLQHNFVRFSTYFDNFKYSMLGSFFPHPTQEGLSQYNSLKGYKALIVHRLEFTLFDKIGITVNEACMYFSKNNEFSLAMINPFGFMHNEYVPYNGNSLLVFEANYTPINGINVYGQFALDEFSGPEEGNVFPSAKGILAGAKTAFFVGDGVFKGSFEFAETDPYLYIRGIQYYGEDNTLRSGYGYDALVRMFCNGIVYKNDFVTYRWGNDAIVFDLKGSYEINSLNIGLELMYMKHGVIGINSLWTQFDADTPDDEIPSTPATFDPGNNETKTANRPVETTLMASLTASYDLSFVPGLSINAIVDYVKIQNMDNIADNNQWDLQVTAGLSYSL